MQRVVLGVPADTRVDDLRIHTITDGIASERALATVTRITLDRIVDETIVLPAMITFDALDDGGFVWAEAESNFDFHLVRRWPDGTDEHIWSCRPWMQSYSDESWACATIREYGPHPGGYRFDPPESTFDRQHMPAFTDEGTLLVSTHDGLRQVAREYAIDDAALVIAPVREIESPDYAQYGGEIRALPSGNRLWQLGTAGVGQEITRRRAAAPPGSGLRTGLRRATACRRGSAGSRRDPRPRCCP